ncbi:hypothetical protein H9P43_008358 [Blastocladiella emersonii ATCC 22665]|nr:hypothetical protein H9P43_008358 [Blastocladiella emersonii ATCC 22665]
MSTSSSKSAGASSGLISAAAVAHNARSLDFMRSLFSVVAGTAAGVLGLTGFAGFGFYIAASLAMSAVIVATKCVAHGGGSPSKFFKSPVSELVGDGLTSGIFAYVLFWTMVNGIIRIYG